MFARSPARPVEAYLGRLRRRAALLHLTRATLAVAGVSGLIFAVGALALGPLSGQMLAIGVWAAVLAGTVAVAVWAWRQFRPLRGSGVAQLLLGIRPELHSRTVSAYELSRQPPEQASPAMVKAHEEGVRRALAEVPASNVMRWRWLRQRTVGLGLVAITIAFAILATSRGRAGAFGLTHPGARDEAGDRIAVAFGEVEAHLVYPSYLDRPSITVRDPSVLEVPRGTSVELHARARVESRAAAMRVGGRAVPLERDESDRWTGRFVAREDGPLVLRLQRPEGDWVRDAVERQVRTLADLPPSVSILAPSEDVVVDQPEEIAFLWQSTDEVGVASVDLVIRADTGEETRRRIATYEEAESSTAVGDSTIIDMAMLGVIPGQSLQVWVEARDGDVVNGPNVGRSGTITVMLASESSQRDQRLASLLAVLDRAIHLLADRLETPVPENPDESSERLRGLAAGTGELADSLRTYANELRRSGSGRALDRTIYTEMASRLRRLLSAERFAHRSSRTARHEMRIEHDAASVTELENDVLTLADLVARARVEDAAEIARELESIRREIRSLLSELRRTDSPEARQRLLAAIARAQTRIRELMQRQSEMGTSVPQEFMNAGDLPTQESADTLARLREAVQRGDMDAAERLANDLQRQIDQIARALGQTEEGFAEARFGERDRAMANAMESLAGLEAEQQQLARRGTERRSRAAQRALDTIGGRDNELGRRMADQAREVRRGFERIDRRRLASFEQDTYDRARQRLVDAEDALRAGDLGEGREMSGAAANDVANLSRDLDLSALMFAGHEGETSEDAASARATNAQLRDLRHRLDESLPDVGSHVTPADRQGMRGDVGRQRQAREATEALEHTFDEGPDGTPLMPDAAREQLREVNRAMERAGDALNQGDVLESAREQEDAARRLTELREQLEEENRGGSRSGQGGSSANDFRRPVDIPRADQFEGPMELRRRLLDAMRASPPEGYEDAVRQYYEGLLR